MPTIETMPFKVTSANRLILPLSPRTYIKTTHAEVSFFHIPENCPNNCGLPRKKKSTDENGCPHCLSADNLLRKRRLEKYFEWKAELAEVARKKSFTLPPAGAAIYFFIPMPARWPKPKRKRMYYAEHMQKPDVSNLLKAFEDALIKKDETIYQYSGLGKFWVDTKEGTQREGVCGPGWIEVHLNMPKYNPVKGVYL